MKLGIMQPYFVPYLGYWQLLNAVDQYVIYDDVNYIKGGWINRNRILCNGNPTYFNLPVIGASPNKLINEIKVNLNEKIMNKSLKTIQQSYAKAPYFDDIYPLIENIMLYKEENLALFIKHSFEVIAKYLDIDTKFVLSSDLNKDNSLKGQDKVIHICNLLQASEYYNAIGGQELYSYDCFEKNNIILSFLDSNLKEYTQLGNEFVPGLSIVDIMMFNSKETCKELLNDYSLIQNN